jgi:AraC-like DNA-binding protein
VDPPDALVCCALVVDTVLSIASRAVVEACAHLGLDGEALLGEAGLRKDEVFDPDRRIPAARADALWQAAYARAGDPHLALHAAEALPFGAYKVVDFLAAHSPTIGDAFRRIAAYFPLVDPRAAFAIFDEGDATVLEMRARDPGVELPPPAQEYSLGAIVLRARTCAGEAWAPDAVEMTFPEPADTAELRRIFRCELRFGRPAPRLVCGPAAWNAEVVGADPALLSVLEDHAKRLLAELPPSDDFVSRVRRAIADELASEEVTPARIAKRLATSERTLQRRLKESGQSVAGLLDEARAATAKAHLADPAMSLADIAFLLHFSDQSAFTRAFRRWTGQTPGAFRAALVARPA